MSVDVPESTSHDAAGYGPDDAARVQRAVEAAELGTWEWDAVSEAVRWDARLEQQFGLVPGEFAGTVEAWVGLVWPADRDDAIAEFQRAVANKDRCYLEHRVLWPDGTVHWVAAQGGVLLDCDGRVTGLAGLCRDITVRRREQEQRQAAHWGQTVLNRAGDLVTESLEVGARLHALASDVLSELADSSVIHLVDFNDDLGLTACHHSDAGLEQALRGLMQTGPHQPPEFAAMLTGHSPHLLADATELAWLEPLSVRSAYFVPLVRHERTLGGVTLLRTDERALPATARAAPFMVEPVTSSNSHVTQRGPVARESKGPGKSSLPNSGSE